MRGVDAAVVELEPLADAVRAGAEDQHARPVVVDRLVLVLVGRVAVAGARLDLGGARVDRLVDRHARRRPMRAARTVGLGRAEPLREPRVAEAVPLRAPPQRRRRCRPSPAATSSSSTATMRASSCRNQMCTSASAASASGVSPRAQPRQDRVVAIPERHVDRPVEARRRVELAASAAPCRTPRRTCGRSTSPRRPTSSAWSAARRRRGTSRTRTAASSRRRSRASARSWPAWCRVRSFGISSSV